MATKAPDFQQGITPSNFQAYVQKGVVDQSKALEMQADINLASGLLKTGMDAYQAYDKQSALSDVTEQMNQLAEERYSRSLEGVQNLQQGLASNENQRKLIKEEAGYNESYPIMLNTDLDTQVRGINSRIDEQTSKLLKAKEQGIMDEFELGERLAKITREALAKNPAYAGEIMGHVSKVADIMNITAQVKQDVKTVKAQQEALQDDVKQLRTTGISLGISPWNPKYQTAEGVNYDLYARDVNTMMFFKENKTRLDSIKDIRGAEREIDADVYKQSGQFIIDQETLVNNFTDRSIEIIQSNAPNKQLALDQLQSEILQDMNSILFNVGLSRDIPGIKDGVEYVEKRITELKKGYVDYASGKMTKEEYDNVISTNKNAAIMRVAEDFKASGNDYWKWSIFMDNAKQFPQLFQSEKSIPLWDAFKTSNFVLGTPDDVDVTGRLIKSNKEMNGKSGLEIFTQGAIDKVRMDPSDENLKHLDETIDKHNRIMSNPNLSERELAQAVQISIKSLQDPIVKDYSNKLDATTLSVVNQNILDYTQVLENDVRVFKERNPNLSLQTVRREDGTISIKGLPVGSTMARGVKAINEAYRAFYNSSFMSIDEAANEFYKGIPSLGLSGVSPSQKQ